MDIWEEALEKQLKKRRRQNGLLLRNVEILEQMEKDLQGNYIPVKLKKDGGLDKTSSVTSEKGFAAIRAHVESLLVRMGREIQRGSVGPNPYKKGGYNSRGGGYKSAAGRPVRARRRDRRPRARRVPRLCVLQGQRSEKRGRGGG